jgi:putative restriction endonuclease
LKLYVGVTDGDWFQSLERLGPDEVNFWQPGGGRTFKVLQPGEPFLFKLHSPNNFIAGGGFFVRNSSLPASLAWDAFERKNGVLSLQDLRARIRKYRPGDPTIDPIIGCNILTAPFFLPRKSWIPIPSSFSLNIVSGKGYDTSTEEGAALWAAVQSAAPQQVRAEELTMDGGPRFGDAYLTRGRLGQGAFRVLVTDAYQRRCAVTGEKTLPVLEAAHIKPYSDLGPHRICNGILLRSDLHKLFDLGYVTITSGLRLEVSPRLKEEWQNGREYYAYHGKELAFRPVDIPNLPSPEFLTWHSENRFRS